MCLPTLLVSMLLQAVTVPGSAADGPSTCQYAVWSPASTPQAAQAASAQHAPHVGTTGLDRALQDDVAVDAEGPGRRVRLRHLPAVPCVQVGIERLHTGISCGRNSFDTTADLEAARLAALVVAGHDRGHPRAQACAGLAAKGDMHTTGIIVSAMTMQRSGVVQSSPVYCYITSSPGQALWYWVRGCVRGPQSTTEPT